MTLSHMVAVIALVAVAGGVFAIYLGARIVLRALHHPSASVWGTGIGIGFAIVGTVVIWLGLAYPDSLWSAAAKPSSRQFACGKSEARYGLVIDAGSSGSRIHIFCWEPAEVNALPRVQAAPGGDINERWEKKVTPGLSDSDYKDKPERAARSLRPLIEYAIEKLAADPQLLKQTSLHVMATAGMRQLDGKTRETIRSAVKQYLDNIPVKFGDTTVEVITGDQEAAFAWLAVNALLGMPKPKGVFPTVGILELGGASTQIAFVPSGAAKTPLWVTWGSKSYPLYTRSYLGLGQDEARNSIANSKKAACYPEDYKLSSRTSGTGDYRKCKDAIVEWLMQSSDKNAPRQPKVAGAFLAVSSFYYTFDFLKLVPPYSLKEIDAAGEAHCKKKWADIQKEHPEREIEKFLPHYCFNAAYAVMLLSEVYHFPISTTQIIAVDRLQDQEVSWTLGAMISKVLGVQAVRQTE